MANAILNFHFDFLHTSLSFSPFQQDEDDYERRSVCSTGEASPWGGGALRELPDQCHTPRHRTHCQPHPLHLYLWDNSAKRALAFVFGSTNNMGMHKALTSVSGSSDQ